MKDFKRIGIVYMGVFAVISLLWWGCGPPPSDASLKRHFNNKRPELERLVTMMDEDWNMCRIASDFTASQDHAGAPCRMASEFTSSGAPWPESEWGISKQRWNEYRKMFGKTGLSEGMTRPFSSSDVVLIVWSAGIAIAGTSVGYVHCGRPQNGYGHTQPPCLENNDSGYDSTGAYRYKKVAQDWYIYEEST
jgi:hypothetical protein